MQSCPRIYHVKDVFHNGWVDAELFDGTKLLVPYMTKVEVVESCDKFQTIIILESDSRGKIANIPYYLRSNNASYSFIADKPILFENEKILLSRKSLTVYYAGKSYPVVISDDLEDGMYFVRFPLKNDALRRKKQYFDEERGGSRFADTWFPLIRKGFSFEKRFLHYGTMSAGCATIKYQENADNWTRLYADLMQSRVSECCLAVLEVL